jgi:hypothetical protein
VLNPINVELLMTFEIIKEFISVNLTLNTTGDYINYIPSGTNFVIEMMNIVNPLSTKP